MHMHSLNVRLLYKNSKLPRIKNSIITLYARTVNYLQHTDQYEISFGVSIEIPENHVGLLFPLDTINGTDLSLSNSIKVLTPSDSKKEVKAIFDVRNRNTNSVYNKGERAANLIIIQRKSVDIVNVVDS